MKVLLCVYCMDIRALDPNGEPTACRCGTVIAWWVDAAKGTAKVFSHSPSAAWMIGLHNSFLTAPLKSSREPTAQEWRELHDECTTWAKGYIFHTDQRNCWAAPFKPGWTSDVEWATQGELGAQYSKVLGKNSQEAAQT